MARKTALHCPEARVVREKLGLSQSQFAALIGISPHTLQNWEQGTAAPEAPRALFLRIAERHPEALHA